MIWALNPGSAGDLSLL